MMGYREFVFEGSLPVVKAFLTGLQQGRRWKSGIRFCEDCGVSGESRGHKVLERLRLEKNKTHVLVSEKHAATVTEAVKAAALLFVPIPQAEWGCGVILRIGGLVP